jgi:hypothetical protein
MVFALPQSCLGTALWALGVSSARAAPASAPVPVPVDCAFRDSYPAQYVVYKLASPAAGGGPAIALDGRLDEPAWAEVPFTADFVDISTATTPKYKTKAKIRFDDDFLYVGAVLQEPGVWASIAETCHCVDSSQDQVIFHDNDFEIFVDPNGDTHYYKEFEMNALNATWDLVLNKPYADGGYENSSRVLEGNAFDMQPPLACAVQVAGTINNPDSPDLYWSVEIALPLDKLVVNETVHFPPSHNTYWRINFSRVEWNTAVVNGSYVKDPSCQSCEVPGTAAEDNWVWSRQGEVNMHAPEKWGFLQFSTAAAGDTAAVPSGEWPVRSVAMVVYHAEHAFFEVHGKYTDDLVALDEHADPPILANGICSSPPSVLLFNGGMNFIATISAIDFEGNDLTATIRDDRLLIVT